MNIILFSNRKKYTKFLIKILNKDISASNNKTYRLLITSCTIFISFLIVTYYCYSYIVSTTYPFDVDGIGHAITNIKSTGNCNLGLDNTYSSDRGFFLPLIFATSYCLLETDLSVQILNIAAHLFSIYLIFLISLKVLSSIIIPSVISLIWSVWPAYNFIYGFYFPEPLSCLFILFSVLHLINISHSKEKSSILSIFLLIISLTLLINIRASSVFFVLFSFCIASYYLRNNLKKLAFIIFYSFIMFGIQPSVNYYYLHSFVPTTTQGGFALFLGTYVPGKSSPASIQRQIPEFSSLEAASSSLNSVEKDTYFKKLSYENIKQDPYSQLYLCIRKAAKFWFNLDNDFPTTKSLIVGLPIMLLWLWSFLHSRTSEIIIINYSISSFWLIHTLIYSEYRYSFVVFPLILISIMLSARTYFLTLSKHFQKSETDHSFLDTN